MYSFCPQSINDHEIICEHIRVLIIFGGDILSDGITEGNGVRAAEWDLKDVSSGRG